MKVAGETAVRILFLVSATCGTAAQAQTRKPNVVYFVVDNLGMGEVSSGRSVSYSERMTLAERDHARR
jgi:alkaline phosphatase